MSAVPLLLRESPARRGPEIFACAEPPAWKSTDPAGSDGVFSCLAHAPDRRFPPPGGALMTDTAPNPTPPLPAFVISPLPPSGDGRLDAGSLAPLAAHYVPTPKHGRA